MMKSFSVSMLIVAVYFAGLYWLTRGYTFFPFLLVTLLVLSLLTLLLYGLDKRAAIQQRQRTPEKTLHLLSLTGGWPGALIARPLFRHKTRKQPFTGIFWCTAILSVSALAAFLLLEQASPAREWLDIEALQWRLFVQQYLSSLA